MKPAVAGGCHDDRGSQLGAIRFLAFLGRRAALLSLLASPAVLLAQIQSGPTQIPTDAPPTGPSRVVPPPAVRPPDPFHPLQRSPDLQAVEKAATAHPLTLDEAIAIALGINPGLALAGQNVEIYSGRVGEAQSALGPNLGLSPAEVMLHHATEPGYGLAATMPIDISNLLASAVSQARFEEIAARLDVNRIRNDTIFGVTSAFYQVLRARALVRVSVQDLQNSLDRLNDAEVRYKAQSVAYIDVLRAQTDVANSQRQVISARNTLSNAIASFNNAMGIEVTTPTRVTDAGSVAEPPGVAPPALPPPSVTGNQGLAGMVPAPNPNTITVSQGPASAASADADISQAEHLGPEFEGVLQEALADRPEILEANAQIEAAKKGITIAERSVLPSMTLGAGYFDQRSVTGQRYNEPQAFVGLSIPIFDSGLAQARVREAKATVGQTVTQRRQAIDSVTLDVQQSYLALVQARDQVAVANQALSEARGAFDLARIRYVVGVSSRAGISPLLEVSDAQAALTVAEQNQVNALYDYNGARARLDHAIGRFAR